MAGISQRIIKTRCVTSRLLLMPGLIRLLQRFPMICDQQRGRLVFSLSPFLTGRGVG